MEKYARKIESLINDNIYIKSLFILMRCRDSEKDRKEYWARFEAMGEDARPPWTKGDPFVDIDATVETIVGDARRECYESIMSMLRVILYAVSAIAPMIDEERSFNMALGNPLALWLYDYADHIDTLCKVAATLTNNEVVCGGPSPLIPQCLVRLPGITARCREFLFPKIVEVNALCEKECAPEYLALFKYKNLDPAQ
jgi:hypothetical protein